MHYCIYIYPEPDFKMWDGVPYKCGAGVLVLILPFFFITCLRRVKRRRHVDDCRRCLRHNLDRCFLICPSVNVRCMIAGAVRCPTRVKSHLKAPSVRISIRHSLPLM